MNLLRGTECQRAEVKNMIMERHVLHGTGCQRAEV